MLLQGSYCSVNRTHRTQLFSIALARDLCFSIAEKQQSLVCEQALTSVSSCKEVSSVPLLHHRPTHHSGHLEHVTQCIIAMHDNRWYTGNCNTFHWYTSKRSAPQCTNVICIVLLWWKECCRNNIAWIVVQQSMQNYWATFAAKHINTWMITRHSAVE